MIFFYQIQVATTSDGRKDGDNVSSGESSHEDSQSNEGESNEDVSTIILPFNFTSL